MMRYVQEGSGRKTDTFTSYVAIVMNHLIHRQPNETSVNSLRETLFWNNLCDTIRATSDQFRA